MSDYAEFIAGTDPTNAGLQTGFRFGNPPDQPVSNCNGRPFPTGFINSQTLTNNVSWMPLTDWLQATGSPMSYTATNVGSDHNAHLFRVQVRL